MILKYKNGACIASGRATKNGSEVKYIGTKQTAKFEFSLKVDSEKQPDGSWKPQWLNCALWGDQAEEQPGIAGGDMVFVCGKVESREWEGRDGEIRHSEEMRCDFVMSNGKNTMPDSVPPIPGPMKDPVDVSADDFTDIGDSDGELPF